MNSLLLMPAQRVDEGAYTCVARNKVGEASFTVNLKLLDKGALAAPRFVEHLVNETTIPEGQSHALTCTSAGRPAPLMTWTKDDKPLVPPASGDYRIETSPATGTSTLFINKAQRPRDEAWFQCTAENPAGTSITKTRVKVMRKKAIFVFISKCICTRLVS